MQRVVGFIAVLMIGAAAFGAGLREVNPPLDPHPESMIAIVGARLIDGRGGAPIENSVVLIRGQKIIAAGPADRVPLPDGGPKVVEARGMTIVPGLLDSHFHSSGRIEIAQKFLRNGVTTARDPGAWIEKYEPVLQSKEPMPRLFLTGPHLDQPPPAYPNNCLLLHTPDEARDAVDRFVQQGASAMKVYFRLPLPLIAEVCRAADAHGIPVTAHLELVDADAAIEAGIDGVEHVTSVGTAVAEPAVAERFRAAVTARNDARDDGRYELWSTVDLSSPRVKRMVELMAARRTVLSPTLLCFERRTGEKSADDVKVTGFKRMLGFVGLCADAGVPVAVGSHTMLGREPGGQGLQREMELLVEAGLKPMKVITAATLGNARFFGCEDRLGTIEPGKLADLVLIEGDPAQDISAMRQVRRVMLNGSWVFTTEAAK